MQLLDSTLHDPDIRQAQLELHLGHERALLGRRIDQREMVAGQRKRQRYARQSGAGAGIQNPQRWGGGQLGHQAQAVQQVVAQDLFGVRDGCQIVNPVPARQQSDEVLHLLALRG